MGYTGASISLNTKDVIDMSSAKAGVNLYHKWSSKVDRIANKAVWELRLVFKEIVIANAAIYGLNEPEIVFTRGIQSSDVTIGQTNISGWTCKLDGHYIYVEFGTGIVGAMNISHPKLPDDWTYDEMGHGESGWFYFKDGRIRWTMGQKSRPFFYKSIKEFVEGNFLENAIRRGLLKEYGASL